MKIQTSRFGEIVVDDQAIINVPGGLIGFPGQERYVIIRHKPDSPFFWFQAIDDGELAFVIVDPLTFKPDYRIPVSRSLLAFLNADDSEELGIYVIVTIPQGHPQDMTANLLGPVVINTRGRLARQLILDEAKYSHRHPVMTPPPKKEQPAPDRNTPRP